jgi:hypothetical protein
MRLSLANLASLLLSFTSFQLLRKRILKIKVLECQLKLALATLLRKFTHTDYYATHCILQSGRSNWPSLLCLWDLQVLFLNLFTCAEGHGNHTNGIFGMTPPSVAEYLYSTNHDLLIPLPQPLNEDNYFGAKPEGN